MKTFRFLVLAGVLTLLGGLSSSLQAQVNEGEGLTEEQKSSALLYEFEKDYDVVFKGIQQGLVDAGYEVYYKSKRRNLVESGFKILAPEDDFFDIMEQYGKIPYVRSPSWKNGRTKISVTLEETGSSIIIKVQAEMSAFEERFLNKWLYWPSNGVIEEDVLQAIIAAVDAEGSDSDL